MIIYNLLLIFSLLFTSHEWNLEELLETIWDYTKMIRIYTKVQYVYIFIIVSPFSPFPFQNREQTNKIAQRTNPGLYCARRAARPVTQY